MVFGRWESNATPFGISSTYEGSGEHKGGIKTVGNLIAPVLLPHLAADSLFTSIRLTTECSNHS
jgi:hypothetical protein